MGSPYRLSFLAGLVALVLLLPGCNDANGSNDEQRNPDAGPAAPVQRSIRVETTTLEPATFEDVIELTGEVAALNDATLSAQTAGTVLHLAPLGRALGTGNVAVQLDTSLVRAAVEQAEAQVAVAQAQLDLATDVFNRQQPLFQDSIMSALEFEQVRAQRAQAEAQFRQARASLRQAEAQLKFARVTVPFSGIVEEHLVEEGEQVTPGMPLVRIVSTRLVKVTAGVPERYANDINVGTPVKVDLRKYGMEPIQGRVSFVGSVINTGNRTFPIEVSLDNSSGQLKPQMVTALSVTRAQLADVIAVPQTALIRDENGVSVFVVSRTADGAPTVERRTLELGPSYGGRVVVRDGLEAGDELITVGQTNIAAGDRVEVVR
jgi:membrane fusion protein (multidrug efflux system)